MSPAHVLEPTYTAIKQKLLDGACPPGSRLESARIADLVGVSMTPVRDSLNRLVGERLVDLRPGFGFHVPRLAARCAIDEAAGEIGRQHLAAPHDRTRWPGNPEYHGQWIGLAGDAGRGIDANDHARRRIAVGRQVSPFSSACLNRPRSGP